MATATIKTIAWIARRLPPTDWNKIVERLRAIVEKLGNRAPPQAYLLISSAYRKLNKSGAAGEILTIGRTLHPGDSSLEIESAEIALLERKWEEVARCCQEIIDSRGADTPKRTYLLLSRARCAVGDFRGMDSILVAGLKSFPNDIELETAFASSAITRKAWAEALERCQLALQAHKFRRPATLAWMMGRAQRGLDDFDSADRTLKLGLRRHPGDLKLAVEFIEVALARRDWKAAIERAQTTIDAFGDRTPARVYVLASAAHFGKADLCAELAMAQPDWADAVKRWQEGLDAEDDKTPPAIHARIAKWESGSEPAIYEQTATDRRPSVFPNAVFIWIPKTAGTSMFASLAAAGCSKLKTPDLARHAFSGRGLVTFGHMDYRCLVDQGYIARDFDRTALKFAFVRNPFSRAVSLYYYVQKHLSNFRKQPTFEEFLELVEAGFIDQIGLYNVRNLSQCNPQFCWLAGIDAGFVGKVENIEEDFERLQTCLGVRLPRLAVHKRGALRGDVFNKRTKYLVERIYEQDFLQFGYSHDLPSSH